ncbi:MAG TPA: hypothetical protein VLL03_03235 [Burkholderiales bacterium]|nr:hypothetical protein [Burkholderiales bacterium]
MGQLPQRAPKPRFINLTCKNPWIAIGGMAHRSAAKTAMGETLRYRLEVNYIPRVRKVLIKELNRSSALFSVVG